MGQERTIKAQTMARKKVKLGWIQNERARKAAFKKKKAILLKKMEELKTLCDVEAMAIIYGPDNNPPEVWPSIPEAQQLLMAFESLPETEQIKKMSNQASYLQERSEKLKENLQEQEQKNQEMLANQFMHELYYQGKKLDDFNIYELSAMVWMVEQGMKEYGTGIDYSQGGQADNSKGKQAATLPGPFSPPQMNEMVQIAGNKNQMVDQWFIDMMNTHQTNIAGGSTTTKEIPIPHDPYVAGTHSTADIGLFNENIADRSTRADKMLPITNAGGSSSTTQMGLPHGFGGAWEQWYK